MVAEGKNQYGRERENVLPSSTTPGFPIFFTEFYGFDYACANEYKYKDIEIWTPKPLRRSHNRCNNFHVHVASVWLREIGTQ